MTHDPTTRQLAGALRWALHSTSDPAMASADWLAADIRENCPSAVALLTDPQVTLTELRQAKNVFKTMRIVGETPRDRHVGARYYAASIAAGIVHHHARVSRQSDRALHRGLSSLVNDQSMPEPLQVLAGNALCLLRSLPPGELNAGSSA